MNPHKKINSNSPWLLCPSKSFPGKFYYFNGSTGETAWGLSESDHNSVKADAFHKVADNTHSYPEPFGPPADESTNTSSSSTLKKDYTNNTNNNFSSRSSFQNMPTLGKTNYNHTNFTNQASFSLGSNRNGGRNFSNNFNKLSQNSFQPISPIFGQSVFQTYVANKPTQVVWTLTPMLVNEHQPQMLDQITQCEPPNTFLQNPVILQNQFQNFMSQSQTQPFKVNSSTAKGVQTGTPIFSSRVTCESKDVQTLDQEPQTKEEACQTFEPIATEVQTQSEAPKPVLKPSRFIEKSACESIGISTLSLEEEVEDAMEVEVNDAANKLNALKENDLRFLLQAKRRKLVDFSEVLKSDKESNTPKVQSEESVPKKHVTFDLSHREKHSDEIEENDTPDVNCASTSCMEALNFSPNHKPDRIWYIVPDSEVLMTDYEYVESNVLNAQNCRLLVPFAVKSKIEAISRGECRGQHEVFTARLVMRKLTTPTPYIILQNKPETTSSCGEYSILDCCCQYSQDDCDLTLITTSSELFEKATLVGIDCSTYDPFKPQTIHFPVKDSEKSLYDNEVIADTLVNREANTDKLIELTNTYKALNGVNHNHSDLVDLDMSKLDLADDYICKKYQNDGINGYNKLNTKEFKSDVNVGNVKDDVKVSGITKLNSVFNLDDELARYCVKNEVMEARLMSRGDEWKCRMTQATEGVLIDILVKEKVKKNMPPRDLCEAVEKIGDAFKKLPKISNVTRKLSSHLQNSNIAKYNKWKPADFIKLLGFCMILVQCLKETLDYAELNDADDLLSELIKHIEDPNTDVELNLDKVQTPVRSDADIEKKLPVGYRKKRSDVLEYLKKHFTAMQPYEAEKTEPKIVRTVGKDLKLVKIFSSQAPMDSTFQAVVTHNAVEPVVRKNFIVIDAFEEKLNKLNEDVLDYEESLSPVFSGHTYVVNDKIDSTYKNNDSIENEDSIQGESFSSDFNNECLHAFPLIKAFLAELKGTLLLIFNFVSNSMLYIQQNMSESKRAEVYEKINMAHKYILKIVGRLKRIIARETNQGTTLKMLLIQAGDYVEEDKTMSHYKELVAKRLEQAQILEEALNIMLNIVHGDLDAISSN